MRIFFIGILVLFLSTMGVYAGNKLLATVNGKYSIWSYDVTQKVKFLSLINDFSFKNMMEQKDFNEIILHQLISNYLLLEDTKKYGFKISNNEVNATIPDIEKRLGLKSGGLFANAKKVGFTENDFRERLKEELLLDKFKQEFSFSRTKISQNEINIAIDRFLNFNGKRELHIYQISVASSDKSEDLAKEKIDLIYLELKKKKFENVARVSSEDLFASRGGELGWVAEDYLSNLALSAINDLQIGGFTAPIHMGSEYRIFLLKDVRPMLQLNPSNPQHMEQLKEFAKQKLTFEKSQIILEDYLRELNQNASIEIKK